MSKIKEFIGREILDSRGNPTVEVKCILASGNHAKFSVPSGASTGSREACELRDGGDRFDGKGVLKVIENIKRLSENLYDKEFSQEDLDEFLINHDGTKDKSNFGANTILGISVSFAKACAKDSNQNLYEYIGGLCGIDKFKIPQPMFNVINGGKHADSGLKIQEFMIVPIGDDPLIKKIEKVSKVIKKIKDFLLSENFSVSVGDEGGFAPKLLHNEDALDILVNMISMCHLEDNLKIGLDVAASGLCNNGMYDIGAKDSDQKLSASDLISLYENLIKKYPIISIEDGFEENDWDSFQKLTESIGNKVKIVGDDLTVTNPEFIEKAGLSKSINAVIIKPNQIGTLSETLSAIKTAKKYNIYTIVSHRSGETCDDFVADLAVGTGVDAIKSGSLRRGERLAKYNRLLEIEAEMAN